MPHAFTVLCVPNCQTPSLVAPSHPLSLLAFSRFVVGFPFDPLQVKLFAGELKTDSPTRRCRADEARFARSPGAGHGELGPHAGDSKLQRPAEGLRQPRREFGEEPGYLLVR